MKRIGFIWIESEIQLQNELDNCLWNALKTVTSRLVVVCGSKEAETLCVGMGIDSIYYAEAKCDNTNNIHNNNTVDSACNAYNYVMEIFDRFCVDDYDEIVFVDSDMMGSFYPLEKMFERMEGNIESIQSDFWGLIRLAPMYTSGKESLSEHIDSHFLVLRKTVYECIKSLSFCEMVYGENILGHGNNEERFPVHIEYTHALEQLGYKGSAYCDTEKCRNVRNCNNFIWYEGKAYELVKEKKCPFVPSGIFAKKNFFSDDGHDARRLLEYVIKDLDFSQDYLWKKLLSSYNISDIYHALHLDYVLSEDYTSYGKNFDISNKRAAVIIHVYYADLLNSIAQFVMNIPEWIDVYITTSVEENIIIIEKLFSSLKIVNNYHVIKVENRGRDCSALLVGCRDVIEKYEYLCFVHDKKTSGNNGACTIGERFMDSLFENLLGSKEYIYNIMELFENNPYLGIAAPPIPVHGQYFCLKDDAWTCCFDETLRLAERIALSIKVDSEKPPFILSTSFWCRTKALEPLWQYEFTYEDFHAEPMPEDGTISHAIERILPYVAQVQGFYSAVVMTTKNASLHVSNLNYQLMGTVQKLRNNYSISSYSSFENSDFDLLMGFCKRYKRLYIYGTGLYGRKYVEILTNHKIPFDGFVVTKKNSMDKVLGHPVYEFSEWIRLEKNHFLEVGILVAVSVYYQEEISEILEERNISNYYIV